MSQKNLKDGIYSAEKNVVFGANQTKGLLSLIFSFPAYDDISFDSKSGCEEGINADDALFAKFKNRQEPLYANQFIPTIKSWIDTHFSLDVSVQVASREIGGDGVVGYPDGYMLLGVEVLGIPSEDAKTLINRVNLCMPPLQRPTEKAQFGTRQSQGLLSLVYSDRLGWPVSASGIRFDSEVDCERGVSYEDAILAKMKTPSENMSRNARQFSDDTQLWINKEFGSNVEIVVQYGEIGGDGSIGYPDRYKMQGITVANISADAKGKLVEQVNKNTPRITTTLANRLIHRI